MLNAVRTVKATHTISIPQGGTGALNIKLNVPPGTLGAGDYLVLGVKDRLTGRTILRKESEIQTYGEETYANFEFAHEDTKDMFPASYVWDATIYTDAVLDDDGKLVRGDQTGSIFDSYSRENRGRLPEFIITEVIG